MFSLLSHSGEVTNRLDVLHTSTAAQKLDNKHNYLECEAWSFRAEIS